MKYFILKLLLVMVFYGLQENNYYICLDVKVMIWIGFGHIPGLAHGAVYPASGKWDASNLWHVTV